MTLKISKKICLIGDFAVGKTSLVRRFVYDLFDDKYLSTIGVKVSQKTVAVQSDDTIVECTMMLWDLAGSEEFNRVRASYLRGSSGIILVYDVTRPETFTHLETYVDEIKQVQTDAKFIVAGNKFDLASPSLHEVMNSHPQTESVKVISQRRVPHVVTSAKSGQNVENLFRELATMMLCTPKGKGP